MPEHAMMILSVVPRFFRAPDDDNKWELRINADAIVNVKTHPTNYDFLDMDEPTIENESSHLDSSFDMLHTLKLLGGFIISDFIMLTEISIDPLGLQHALPWKAHTNHLSQLRAPCSSIAKALFVLYHQDFALTREGSSIARCCKKTKKKKRKEIKTKKKDKFFF